MNLTKTITGNYVGYLHGHYIFIHKRPHTKWCCTIKKNKAIIHQEGYHTTSLSTISEAKEWAIYKLKSN